MIEECIGVNSVKTLLSCVLVANEDDGGIDIKELIAASVKKYGSSETMIKNDGAIENKTIDGIIDTIDKIKVDTAAQQITITLADGSTEQIAFTPGTPVTITDADGTRYTVDADGNVSKDELDEQSIDDMQANEGDEKNTYLKFIIDETEYQNGDEYYTMYTKKTLEIKVAPNDTIQRDLSSIKWQLLGKEIEADKNDPTLLHFKVKKSKLPKASNDLVVIDSTGKVISKLKIKTYRGPEIVFDEKQHYNGEYLFDHGYEFKSIVGDYETIKVGPKNKIYYAPVLGILKGKHATIRINVK